MLTESYAGPNTPSLQCPQLLGSASPFLGMVVATAAWLGPALIGFLGSDFAIVITMSVFKAGPVEIGRDMSAVELFVSPQR